MYFLDRVIFPIAFVFVAFVIVTAALLQFKDNDQCRLGITVVLKGLRLVLEGFAVTMYEGACEQKVKSRGR